MSDYVIYAINVTSDPEAVTTHAWRGGKHILEVKQTRDLGHGVLDLTTEQAVAVSKITAARVLGELWRREHG